MLSKGCFNSKTESENLCLPAGADLGGGGGGGGGDGPSDDPKGPPLRLFKKPIFGRPTLNFSKGALGANIY